MDTKRMTLGTRALLSTMMLLQFMTLAVWFVPLAAYLDTIGVTGWARAWILSSMAIGCLGSPMVGLIADRLLAAQKVLAVANLLGAVLLVAAARVTEPALVFALLLGQMLCYMPTWGITSAIAMAHAPSEQFPQIRVFGSIGWVASGLCSIVAVQWLGYERFDGTHLPMYWAAGLSALAAVTALVLPDTPPAGRGQRISLVDVLGLRTFTLMRDPQFAVFIVMSLAAMIPFAMYWSYGSAFLHDEGFAYITVTMNWGQAAEIAFMLLVPVALAKLGIRWTMVLGLIALTLRYVAFWLGVTGGVMSLYFAAILVQGIIYGFFFVGGQIYIDRRVPVAMRAQAQGAMFLVTFGLGLLLGNFLNEWLIGMHTSEGATDWGGVWAVLAIASAVLTLVFAGSFRRIPAPGMPAAPAAEAGAATMEVSTDG